MSACAYCGGPGPLEREHVEPISRGGTDTPDNTVWACFPCNRDKGNRFLLEWVFGLPRRKRPNRWQREEVMRLRELEPGITRSEVARRLGVHYNNVFWLYDWRKAKGGKV